jgi:hypothetical protein
VVESRLQRNKATRLTGKDVNNGRAEAARSRSRTRSNYPGATELVLESSIHAQRLLVGSNRKVFLSGRMIVWEFEDFLPTAIDDPARKRFFRTAQSIKLSFDPSRQLILSVA